MGGTKMSQLNELLPTEKKISQPEKTTGRKETISPEINLEIKDNECCAIDTLYMVFTIVIGILITGLAISMCRINWYTLQYNGNAELERFMKTKHAAAENQIKTIGEQKRTIDYQNEKITQLKDEMEDLKKKCDDLKNANNMAKLEKKCHDLKNKNNNLKDET